MSERTSGAEEVVYRDDIALEPGHFVDLLRRSGLAARRPVDDAGTVTAMVEHADLTVTAWRDDTLVGVARSLTDFRYCCYLADLAVDRACQRRGIGRGLIEATRAVLGPHCMLLLLAAPAAVDYYPHLGFERHPQAWLLREAGHDGAAR